MGDSTPTGIARQQALLRFAASLVEGSDAAILSLPPDALSSLRDDRILTAEPHRDVARFAHDILEDWTLMRLVDVRRGELASFLRAVRETYRLQRAVRLFACSLLERGGDGVWRELLTMLESDQTLAPRWRHAFLSSPLVSVRASSLLDRIKDVLVADDGRRLAHLLTAARTIDVSPDLSNFPGLAFVVSAPDELLSLVLHQPVPHWAVWTPLLAWLIENAADLPPATRPQIIRLFELWQVHTDPSDRRVPRGVIYRGEIADVALSWLGGHAQVPAGSREKDVADHAERLRRIILRSADARPDITADVLMLIADGWNESAAQQMLTEARNSAAFIAPRYVDAVLHLLQPLSRNSDRGWGSRGVLNDYGFRHDYDFYPPSHGQGPFIWLLRENEVEALRLVHSLANTAIDRWRESQTNPAEYAGTPVPLTLRFPWGDQQFWGGPTEYMWFRADGRGPNCVVSALMALEFWMEEQLATSRDAEDLFEKVLSGSRCIAVPALCLGVTLAEQKTTLSAALPIVSSPLIWLLDVRRVGQDYRPSLNYDPLGQHETMTLLRKDRDDRPQRKIDVRNLAPAYLFGENEQLRDAFVAALDTFTAEIPVLYEEQRMYGEALDTVRRELEQYKLLARRENWSLAKQGDDIYLISEPSQTVTEEERAAMLQRAEQSTWLQLHLWAQKTLEKNTLDTSLSVEDVMKECQRLYSADLFARAMQFSDGFETFRREAVAAGVAALVVVAGDWVRANGHLDWCRGIFREAAGMPHGDVEDSTRRVSMPSHPRVSAIRGLTALIRDGVAMQVERELLLTLCMEWNSEFQNTLSRGLADIWSSDPELGWALLTLSVHRMTLFPRKSDEERAKRNAALLKKHLAAFRRGERIPLPSVERAGDRLDCYLFQDTSFGLPLDKVVTLEWARPQVLQLLSELGRWTLGRNRADKSIYRQALYEWNPFFARTLARLAASLEDHEYETLVLAILKDSWQEPLEILPDYLGGYLGWQLAGVEPLTPVAISRWDELARWLLNSNHLAEYASQRYSERATEDAISWLVFTSFGENYFKTVWPHAAVFTDTIDVFVSVLGKDSRAYRRLLIFLSRFFDRYPVATVLRWLCANDSQPPSADFYTRSDVGLRTAQLLHDLWRDTRDQILDHADLERRYALIVDQLLVAGVALAKVLADRLAERG